jgi:uncharacterized repeat protein (TIGR01451 family)
MKFKKMFLIICIIVCLFAMASVCASEANDTTISIDDEDQYDLAKSNGITEEITSESDNTENDEILATDGEDFKTSEKTELDNVQSEDTENNNLKTPTTDSKFNYTDLSINIDTASSIVNVGDTVEITVTVKNNGPGDETGLYALAPLNITYFPNYTYTATEGTTYDGYTWIINRLNASETATLKISAEVVTFGAIKNYVEIFGFGNDTDKSNNNDAIEITANPAVDLAITKNVDVTCVHPGDNVVFNITVRNNGPCDATNVTVSEVLSEHLTMVEYSTWDSYYDADEGVWHIGNLTKNDWRQIFIVAKAISVGVVSNEVSVTSTEYDTNKSNNKACSNNVVIDEADLMISQKSNVTSGVVYVGDLIEFTVTARNNGILNESGIFVLAPLNGTCFEYYKNSTDKGTYDGYTWVIGNMTAGETATLKIVAKVINSGSYTNYVEIFAQNNDKNKSNNNASLEITSLPTVDLVITLSVDTTLAHFGDIILFGISVRNNGPCDATNVTVSEVLSEHLNMTEYWTWDSSYDVDKGIWYIGDLLKDDYRELFIKAEAISEGVVSNEVTVTSAEKDTNESNNKACVSNIVINETDLMISIKSNLTSGALYVGDLIEFTVTVRNNGIFNESGVQVMEILDSTCYADYTYEATGETTYGGVCWYIGDLNSGETATLKITARVIKGGNLTNYVEILDFGNDKNKSNNNASIEFTSIPLVDLVITKECDVTYAHVGDRVVFIITVVNNGPCDATNVTVSEVLSEHLNMTEYHTWASSYDVDKGLWHIGDLAKDDWRQIYILTQAISVGVVSNEVTVTSTENDTNESNNKACVSNIPIDETDVMISIKSNVTSGVLYAGDLIEFTVTAHNNGACEELGIYVLAPLNGTYFTYCKNSTDKGTYDGYTWVIGNMAADETATLKIVASIVKECNYTNYVELYVYGNDKNKSNNWDELNIVAEPAVDLKVNETVDKTEAIIGDEITYTISIFNNGPSNASNINVTYLITDNVEIIRVSPSTGQYSNGIWQIGTLNKDAFANLTITVKALRMGILESNVSAICLEKDRNVSNNQQYCCNVTVDKIATELSGKAITTTYNKNKNLVITLKDENGNPVSGVKVSVEIKSSKKYTTDKNGQIKVSTEGFLPNKYTAKISFAEDDKYKKSSINVSVTVKKAKPKMSAKTKKFKVLTKTKKYTITLKNNIGEPIKKAKVTLKVKGKTYKATTNSKGKATFKITKLNKVGTYKAVIKYKGNKCYEKLTKKVKIKVYFKTISKGSKDKNTVKKIQQALKDNGYYLTYKGHNLKVDGKYGSCTARSVKEFQHDKGLKVTGSVDEKTAKKLGIIN